MIPTDAQLCAAAAAAYVSPATFAVSDIHAVVTSIDNMSIVAFRGTVPTSWRDWFRDVDAVPTPVMDHPRLGLCHRGFMTGAEAILPMLPPILTGPFCLTGHSLGGALAVAAAALLADLGRAPAVLTTFGAPRVGIGCRLSEVLAGVPGRSYRHGDDPVTTVPIWPFRHPRALTAIGVAEIDALADHAISGYALALTDIAVKLNSEPAY